MSWALPPAASTRSRTQAAARSRSSSRRASAMARQPSHGPPGLLEAVRDAPAREVVRRDLDPDAVAREDADAVAAHLARKVTEHLVPVVELDAEHQAGQGLGDLALELHLLFYGHEHLRFSWIRPRQGPLRADVGNAAGLPI